MKGDIVKEYLDKFAELPSLTLARTIYKRHPEAFKDVEDARQVIRYYRGSKGSENRKKQEGSKYLTEHAEEFRKFFGLVEGEREIDYKPYILPKANNRILILSDIHLPYHDREAVCDALNYGKEKKVNTIILNGDILDFYQASYFVKDPRNRDLQYEVDVAIDFFQGLRDNFPNALIVYKIGNHEERYEKYLMQKAPELLNLDVWDIESVLRLHECNIQLVKDKRVIKVGELNIIHGHEITRGTSSPVNPARTFFLKAKTNVIGGHLHRTSEHISKDLDDSIIGAWSTGCLCDLHPKYAPQNEWNHGYAYVSVNDNGSFWVMNRKIL